MRVIKLRSPRISSAFGMLTTRIWQIYARILVNRFHRVYYATTANWSHNTYCGYRVLQFPGDLWLYQELIYRERPAFIIQTGVAYGGSLLFFAHMLDRIQADATTIVVGIDIQLSETAQQLNHPRIHLIEGNSTDPHVVRQVESLLPAPMGMVSLDSDHSCTHVLREIECYRHLVRVGCYLVVEDTNLNGHPVWENHGAGPYEAVEQFLCLNQDFIRDDNIWRRNLFSFHQYGWLKRVQ